MPPGVAAQARRMLADPKRQALIENFSGQWLELRRLARLTPDKQLFPDFDAELASAMREETERFFAAIVAEDRSVLDFLDADFTFVNERLARHYGMADVQGREFRRVELTDNERGGLLTQASILTLTSNPTRTSPVKRGKWVLENLLGGSIPPPPPGVPALVEDPPRPPPLRCASGSSSIARTPSVPRVTRGWIRSVWGWKTTTRSAFGDSPRGDRRSTRRAKWEAGHSATPPNSGSGCEPSQLNLRVAWRRSCSRMHWAAAWRISTARH